ncbi:MAG: 6-phosphogluconolactonase [Pedobacter sp.]|nr:6-phosphogluconolactonase [Pedobacter sp.]
MNQLIYNDKDDLLNDLAAYILKIGSQAIDDHGSFNFVLTGGNSPKTLYKSLATTYKEQLDWTKVYFFFGDERYVDSEASDYNGRMARESILAPLNIPAEHIFYVNTKLTPKDAASDYMQKLSAHFQGELPSFDLILLGMGDEAHTASLFPFTEILQNKTPTVESVYVEKLSAYRVSFTAPLINLAKNIAFLVFGSSKAEAVKEVIEPVDKNPMLYPAQLIQPSSGNVTWFMDKEAAALLTK